MGEKLPQLIKPKEVKVVTKDGECQVSIVLELNINLNTDNVVVSAQAIKQEIKQETKQEKPKESGWEIPDFENFPKINFGKKQE